MTTRASKSLLTGIGGCLVKAWGPYVHRGGKNIGRKFVVIRDVATGRVFTMFYSRWLMTVKLDRFLSKKEEVDHADENKSNDDIKNLQILDRQKNAAKMGSRLSKERPAARVKFICKYCGKSGLILARRLKYRRSQGNVGPFCNKSCSAKWLHKHKRIHGRS